LDNIAFAPEYWEAKNDFFSYEAQSNEERSKKDYFFKSFALFCYKLSLFYACIGRVIFFEELLPLYL
jgi:hypothetical protein